jgi:hypothetical protein
MKTYCGVKVNLHAFLNLALDGSEWSASRPGRFIPGERVHDTHWIGGWVGPSAGLDTVVKRKITIPCRELNLDRPAGSLVVIPTELLRLMVLKYREEFVITFWFPF